METIKLTKFIKMIHLHPEFLTKNGKKEFAVLPYEEFVKLQELLHKLEEDSQIDPLKEIKEIQEKSLSDWEIAISQIEKSDKTEKKEKIKVLFDSWQELEDEEQQQETLEIIQGLEDISI